MPEGNNLPDSGRIDLNKQANPSENIPNSEIPIEETKIEEPKIQLEAPVAVQDHNLDIPPENIEKQSETGKFSPKVIATAAIVAGILVMSAGYVAYRYFSRDDFAQLRSVPTAEVQIDNEADYEGIIENLNGRIASGVSTSRAEEWEEPGDSSGIVAFNSDSFVKGSNVVAQQPTAGVENPIAAAPSPEVAPQRGQTPQVLGQDERSTWTANNYEKGDIKSGSYTVVSGDTLWEIAEAVYGNGGDWHKIADANSVSYLANGNSLILPGQILNIPT